LATVCLLPWIHGGNIPLARLVLQVGSAGAALLSLVSCSLRGKRLDFPRIVFPLGILAAVGVIQLTPVHAPLISQMNHAVLAELRPDFVDLNQREATVRTASPGDTRMVLGQLIALILLTITAFDQIRTRRAIKYSLAAFTANASVLSLLAIVQQYQTELFLIRDVWWTGSGIPFGTFVNPNNAANWLALGLAAAVGLILLQFENSATSVMYARHNHGAFGLLSGVVRYVAMLTWRQVLVWFAAAVIACGIAATRSRGGMLSVVPALAVMLLMRLHGRQLVGVIVSMVVGGLLISGFLILLNLHQGMLRELETLRDPAGELAVRTLHWRDTLQSAHDFPVFGGGLGAYRYVTLPYQTRDTGFWFQNADNQYLEMLVESGVVGFVAFVMVGLSALVSAIHVVRRSVVGATGRLAEAIALLVVFATVTQAVSALADFGVGLPAASALFVVLVSMLAVVRTLTSSGAAGAQSSGPLVAYGMRFALIAAGLSFTTDLLTAHQCYMVTVSGKKVRQLPVSWEVMEQRELLLQQAEMALTTRSDDARTLELVSSLQHDLLRSQFLKGLPGVETTEQFHTAWPHTDCLLMIRRADSFDNEVESQRQLRGILGNRLRASGIVESSVRAIERLPLLAPVVRRSAKWLVSAGNGTHKEDLLLRARFNEPANGKLSLDFGELLLRNGRSSEALEVWQQAVKANESLRYHVLTVYSATGQLEQGLAEIGPATYGEAVMALIQSRQSKLTDHLTNLAASLWLEPESPPTVETQQFRNEHLRYLGDLEGRIEWLERCVLWQPDSLQFHHDLATACLVANRWGDSEDQWYQVLRLDPGNLSAERGIAAIHKERQRAGK